MAQDRRPPKRHYTVPGECSFCEQKLEPDYKDAKVLRSFLTNKGKIVARSRSGICLKHQRRLALSIKRARQMALLPYVTILS